MSKINEHCKDKAVLENVLSPKTLNGFCLSIGGFVNSNILLGYCCSVIISTLFADRLHVI